MNEEQEPRAASEDLTCPAAAEGETVPRLVEPTEDAPDPDVVAWIESLGPGGAERLAAAGGLLAAAGSLLSEAGTHSKTMAIGPLEDLDRRMKVLAARAEVSGFDWVNEFVRGGQKAVAAMSGMARGNRFVSVWRHEQAKKEFRHTIKGMGESLKLLDSALEKVPHLGDLAQFPAAIRTFALMLQQLIPTVIALEKNCDVDALLLEGRIKEYISGVRTLAGELRRMSDGILGTGSEDPGILETSGSISMLADTIEERAEAIEEACASRDTYLPPVGDKIFIIHGHAEDKWRELRDLLEDRLGLKDRIVVLKEEASQSKTVIGKFEEFANRCCYAFALVTPDDLVEKADGAYRQSRPNVLFEIGWFYGRFGPRRLCILRRQETLLPSDLGGVVTIEFSAGVKECLVGIEDELKAAGVLP